MTYRKYFDSHDPNEPQWSALFLDSAGFIDISRLPVLPLAIALVAGYAIHFMAMHGIFQALSALGVR